MGLTVERMMELGEAHEVAEFAHDWDATLATLVDHPVYYWYPQRLRIEGREAVRRLYECIAPIIDKIAAMKHTREFAYITHSDDGVGFALSHDYEFSSGEFKKVHLAAFLRFEGDKLVGETQYTDHFFAAEFDRAIDDDFLKMPGVTRF